MRFSVKCAFPYLGKRGAVSRKSAFCNLRLTEKRSLEPVSHGKAHSGLIDSRKSALCAFPLRRGAREVWGNPPPGCGALWRMSQLGKCARATPRQAAGWVARGFANLGLEFGLTEKRILKPSGPATSRKTALWPRQPRAPHGKAQFGRSEARRMRLSVRTRAQNALSRDVPRPECAFSVKCAFPHLCKRRAASRKSALCPSHLTEKRTLQLAPYGKPYSAQPPHQKPHSAPAAPLSPHSSPREWCSKRPFS